MGLLAIIGIIADAVCFLASSLFAHLAAFGTQYSLTTIFTKHLAKVPLGIIIGQGTNNYLDFLHNFIFYLLFTLAIAAVLNKFLYVFSSGMRIAGGVASFDGMMALPELQDTKNSKAANGASVTLNSSDGYSNHNATHNVKNHH